MTLTTDGGPRTVIGVMPPGFTLVGQKADFLIPYGQTLEQLRADARPRQFVRHRAPARRRVVRAGVQRDAEHLRRAREGRAAAQCPPDGDALSAAGTDGRRAPAGAVRAGRRGRCSCCSWPASTSRTCCWRGAPRASASSACARRLAPNAGGWCARCSPKAWCSRPPAASPGLAVAALCHRGLLALVGDRIPVPRLDQVALDLPVVAFTMVTALATGLVFGLVPAFVSTSHASEALRDGGRHGGGRRLHRVLGTLVVAEVALSLVLLAGAGLLMRSLVKLQSIDLGFRAEGVLTAARAAAGHAIRPRPGRQLLPRVAVAHRRAARGSARGRGLVPAGAVRLHRHELLARRSAQAGGRPAVIRARCGRSRRGSSGRWGFHRWPDVTSPTPTRVDSVPVAIVSEELVRQQFPDGSPLGRRLRDQRRPRQRQGRRGMDGRRRRRQHQVVAGRAGPPDDLHPDERSVPAAA